MRWSLTKAQKSAIMKRFGTEPEPYDWTEQDIAIQVRNFVECGVFVKGSNDHEITERTKDLDLNNDSF
jgi:hypothetical protein